MEKDFLASGNRIFFCSEVSEGYTLTNVTGFLAGENHFLPSFQTPVKMEENGSRK